MNNSSKGKGAGLSIGIVASKFNKEYVDLLVQGAVDTLLNLGLRDDDIELLRVPGIYEIPLAVRMVASRCDAVITAACVIRGETAHFEYVINSCRDGVLQIMLETNTPVTAAILTAESHKQARARSGGQVNRGAEAAEAAVEMALLMRTQNKT